MSYNEKNATRRMISHTLLLLKEGPPKMALSGGSSLYARCQTGIWPRSARGQFLLQTVLWYEKRGPSLRLQEVVKSLKKRMKTEDVTDGLIDGGVVIKTKTTIT